MDNAKLQGQKVENLKAMLDDIQAVEPKIAVYFKARMKYRLDRGETISNGLAHDILNVYLTVKKYMPIPRFGE